MAGSQQQDLVEMLQGRSNQLEMLKDRGKGAQLANGCGWGESCRACLPKGQGITHVPVPQCKGKLPEACLICLSILNPSLAASQVWVLVEELKNDAGKASPGGELDLFASPASERAEMLFAG